MEAPESPPCLRCVHCNNRPFNQLEDLAQHSAHKHRNFLFVCDCRNAFETLNDLAQHRAANVCYLPLLDQYLGHRQVQQQRRSRRINLRCSPMSPNTHFNHKIEV